MAHANKTKRRSRTAVAAAVAGCLLAAGCGGSGSGGGDDAASTTTTASANASVDEGTPVSGGNLTIAVESETSGWNPSSNVWALEGNFIGSSMLETLTVVNSKGEAVPWLAESVTPNDDSTEFTIKMREGVKFHDGSEMDAQAVVDSLNFANSEGLASIITKATFGTPVVVDKYTFKLPVNVQYGALPAGMSTSVFYVMEPSMLEKDDKGSTEPAGTGAYKFEKLEKDRYLQVSAFPDYWGGACAAEKNPSDALKTLCDDMGVPLGQKLGPNLDTMEFRPIPDSVQRQQALEAGDVDLILNTRPGITAAMRENYQVVTDYKTEQNFVQLQTNAAPFNSENARLALAYGTDRAGLVKQIGAGEDIPMDTSPFEETSPWGGLAPDQTGYPMYDPEKAKEYIEAYKAETNEPSLSFTLTGTATLDDLEVMQALSAQWATLGIDAKIDSIKKEALIGIQVGGTFQAVISRNYSFPDPDSNFQFWASDFSTGSDIILNFNQFSNDDTQAALMLGRQSSDQAFRKQAYDAFVKERNSHAPDIWLFNTPWALIAEKDVRGLNAFRNLGIAGYSNKPWVGGLWLAPEASS